MKKFLLAPVLAALAMFVFGAIYWMSPFSYKALGRVADDSAAALALAKIFPETGTYLIPGAYLDQQAATELMHRGPLAEVHFVKEGHAPMEVGVLLAGFLHYFVVAVLLALHLQSTSPALKGYGGVVKMTACIGVIAAVFVCLSGPIWWHHPWGWAVARAVYTVLTFVVAGLVLGTFFKSPAPASTTA